MLPAPSLDTGRHLTDWPQPKDPCLHLVIWWVGRTFLSPFRPWGQTSVGAGHKSRTQVSSGGWVGTLNGGPSGVPRTAWIPGHRALSGNLLTTATQGLSNLWLSVCLATSEERDTGQKKGSLNGLNSLDSQMGGFNLYGDHFQISPAENVYLFLKGPILSAFRAEPLSNRTLPKQRQVWSIFPP